MSRMGYTALMSQALSAPPYLVAFVFVLLTAYLSDWYRSRSVFVCISALMGASGYLIIAIAGKREMSAGWRYAGVYPAAAGFFSAVTLLITWTLNNQESDSKKGTGLAVLNIIGQFGPLLGTRLYPDSDKPYYVRGMSVCAGFMLSVFFLALVLRGILTRENSKSLDAYSLAASRDDEERLVDKEVVGARPRRFTYMT
jgi:MFS family permease